jgi:hypothetical protein
MGQVEMTNLISVRTLVGPTAWAEAAKTHALLFTLLPQSLPNVPAREGMRVVDVKGGVADGVHAYQLDPNIVLRHSGLGFVAAGGTGYRETLDASGDLTPKLPLEGTGASDWQGQLQARWSHNLTLQPLEGYPLFGLYKLIFPPAFDFSNTDLILRFYYQWPVNGALLNQRDPALRFSCSIGGLRVPITSASVSFLIAKDDAGNTTVNGSKDCTIQETNL